MKSKNLINQKFGRLIVIQEEAGVPYKTLWKRIAILNWSIEKALTTSVKKYKKRRK